MEWFNDDGSLRYKIDEYFDSDDDVRLEVLNEIYRNIHDIPGNSRAYALYYADVMSGFQESARSLFGRYLDCVG